VVHTYPKGGRCLRRSSVVLGDEVKRAQ
jgi:hypothetical protein